MKILILGASGSLGRVVAPTLLAQTDAELVLAARHPQRIAITNPSRETAIALDVNDQVALQAALTDVDFVFAALTGDLKAYATNLVQAMQTTGVARLAFISSMGIYGEIPSTVGSNVDPYHSVLQPYREAADVIEASDLAYTIIRPGWFDNGPANYALTKKGEPFGGHDVARQAIADLVVRLVTEPNFGLRESLGIHRP